MKPPEDMTGKYRHVFSGPFGNEVLADILTLTRFGCSLGSAEEAAIHNIGVKIIMRLGIFGPETKMDVVRALLTVVPPVVPKNRGKSPNT